MHNQEEILPESLLRALTPEYRDFFFLSEEAKQTEFLYPIPKLLQLEEWSHPTIDSDTDLEKPSSFEVIQLIAKVIATCDPDAYKPSDQPNTHWKNWMVSDQYL